MSNFEKRSLLQLNYINPSDQPKQEAQQQLSNDDDSQSDFDFSQIKQNYNQTFNPSSFSPNHPRKKKKHDRVIQNWCTSSYGFQTQNIDYQPIRRLSKETLKQMEQYNDDDDDDDDVTKQNNFAIQNQNIRNKNSLLSRKLSSSTTDGQFQTKNHYQSCKSQCNLSESEQSCSMSTQTIGNSECMRISPQYRSFQKRQFSFSSDISQNSGQSIIGGSMAQIKVSPFWQPWQEDLKQKISDQDQDQGSYINQQQNNYNIEEILLNPQIQIPYEILEKAQKRFAGIKSFKKHPSIRRLQIEYNTFEQKALFDGTAVKKAIQKNKSPTQTKKSPFSPRIRIRSEDDSQSFASSARLMVMGDRNKTNKKAYDGAPALDPVTEQKLQMNSTYEQQKSPIQTSKGPDTPIPPYILKRNQAQDYDDLLTRQSHNRRHSQDFLYNQTPSFPSNLVQKIEDQSPLYKPDNSIKCSSGMDSITVVKMNKNRKNLPTKGNQKLKLGSVSKSSLLSRRVNSYKAAKGESMLQLLIKKQEEEEEENRGLANQYQNMQQQLQSQTRLRSLSDKLQESKSLTSTSKRINTGFKISLKKVDVSKSQVIRL